MVGSFKEFGKTSLPNDFFDDWMHIGPEDDDYSNEEIALMAVNKLLGCVPGAGSGIGARSDEWRCRRQR
jgi:hypothetical protein